MAEKYSILRFTGDGVKTTWDLTFSGGYLNRDDVKATINVAGAEVPLAFTWVGDNTISIIPALADDVALTIYRDTPKEAPLVDFTDGSIINEKNLDTTARQAIFVAAEMVDKFDDAILAGDQASVDSAAALLASGVAVTTSAAAEDKADLAVFVADSTEAGFDQLRADVDDLISGEIGGGLEVFARLDQPAAFSDLVTVPALSVSDDSLKAANTQFVRDVFIDGIAPVTAAISAANSNANGRAAKSANLSDLTNPVAATGNLRHKLATGTSIEVVLNRLFNEMIYPFAFGAAENGTTDDAGALQNMLDYAGSLTPPGRVALSRGKTYKVVLNNSRRHLLIPPGVELDCNYAKLALYCQEDVYGVRLTTKATIRNFDIEVVESVLGGGQGIWHAPLSIGPAYGEGGTVADPSPYEEQYGWSVFNGTLTPLKAGSSALSIIGGHYGGVIEGVYAKGNGIFADWGAVGPIWAGNVFQCRADYDANLGYTTHPRDISIRNCRIDATTATGHGVRLSGYGRFLVENIEVINSKHSGLLLHSGDLGFHFARPVDRLRGHGGTVIKDFAVLNANDGLGAYADSQADNVGFAAAGSTFTGSISGTTLTVTGVAAGYLVRGQTITGSGIAGGTKIVDFISGSEYGVGVYSVNTSQTVASTTVTGTPYVPAHPLISRMNTVIERFSSRAPGTSLVKDGIFVQRTDGLTFNEPVVSGHSRGIVLEDSAHNVTVKGGTSTGNRLEGVYVGHGVRAPINAKILGVASYKNNTDSQGRYNIDIGTSKRAIVHDNQVGSQFGGETSLGLHLSASAVGVSLVNNYVHAVLSGPAFLIGTDYSYNVLSEMRGNDAADGIAKYAGVLMQTLSTTMNLAGETLRTFQASRFNLSGDVIPQGSQPFKAGERVYFYNGSQGGREGTMCVTSGTPGTWVPIGSVGTA